MKSLYLFTLVVCLGFTIKLCASYPGSFNINGNIQHNKRLIFHVNFFNKPASSHPEGTFPGLNVSGTGNKDIKKAEVKYPTSSSTVIPINDDDDDEDDSDGPPEQPETPRGNFTLTEEQEKFLQTGIEIDDEILETSTEDSPDKLISSPGCPESAEKPDIKRHHLNRDIWVHFGNPPKCFLVGIQGPCPYGMAIGPQPNSTFGICKCRCFAEPELDIASLKETVIDPYLDLKQAFCSVGEQRYASHMGECYPLFTQGPCKLNEAFVLDPTTRSPMCKVRDCLLKNPFRLSGNNDYGVMINGICNGLGLAPALFGASYEIQGEDTCKKVNQMFSSHHRVCVPSVNRLRGRNIG